MKLELVPRIMRCIITVCKRMNVYQFSEICIDSGKLEINDSDVFTNVSGIDSITVECVLLIF